MMSDDQKETLKHGVQQNHDIDPNGTNPKHHADVLSPQIENPKNAIEQSTRENISRVHINVRKTGRFFACIIIGVIFFGALANYSIYNVAPHPEHEIADVLKRFDLGHEPSIPAFYSSIVMLLAAAAAGFLAIYDTADQSRRRISWIFLSFILSLLAIDETVMFHEMGTAAMNKLGMGTSLYFSWVIPGSIFALIAGSMCTRLLLDLPRRTQLLFVTSAFIFLAGAIGMELIAGLIFSSSANELEAVSSTAHIISQAIEEMMEMAGMALFLCSLLDFINLQNISIWVQVPSDAMGGRNS